MPLTTVNGKLPLIITNIEHLKVKNMKYFKLSEFDCQETGENKMNSEFLIKLDLLRKACGFPLVVTSGYRSPSHSIEAKKFKPGTHAEGIAADLKAVDGWHKRRIVEEAIALGFNGIGIAKSFVHVDDRKTAPVIWQYG